MAVCFVAGGFFLGGEKTKNECHRFREEILVLKFVYKRLIFAKLGQKFSIVALINKENLRRQRSFFINSRLTGKSQEGEKND